MHSKSHDICMSCMLCIHINAYSMLHGVYMSCMLCININAYSMLHGVYMFMHAMHTYKCI